MPVIGVNVAEKTAAVSGCPQIVCGNSDYVIAFSFDAEWDAFPAKTARFAYRRNGTFRYEDVLFEGDSVPVPVLRDIDEVAVGVYAGSLHTSTPARIPCARSITDGAAVHDPPTPDVYDQLLEYLAHLQANAPVSDVAAVLYGTAYSLAGTAEETEES